MIKRNKPLKRNKPIRRVSKKRAVQNRIYLAKRAKFLEAHPFCQATILKAGIDEQAVIMNNGFVIKVGSCHGICVPRSTEIHHVRGRIGEMLLNEDHWLAVGRKEHDWIHGNGKEARLLGLLA